MLFVTRPFGGSVNGSHLRSAKLDTVSSPSLLCNHMHIQHTHMTTSTFLALRKWFEKEYTRYIPNIARYTFCIPLYRSCASIPKNATGSLRPFNYSLSSKSSKKFSNGLKHAKELSLWWTSPDWLSL